MAEKLKRVLSVIALGVMAVFSGCSGDVSSHKNVELPTDFLSCEKMEGAYVMESYPRQCKYKDLYFTEVIDEDDSDNDRDFVKGEVLVSFISGGDVDVVISEIEKIEDGVKFDRMLTEDLGDLKIGLFKVPEGAESSFVSRIGEVSGVAYVELNLIMSVDPVERIPTEPEQMVRGEIISIKDGIDGSTVVLKVEESSLDNPLSGEKVMEVFTTLSIPNLGMNSDFDFSAIEVGNKIWVRGQVFQMESKTHLTASWASVVFDKKKKSECEAKGGKYLSAGKARIFSCDVIPSDAGKKCSDSSECEGMCLSENGGVCSSSTVNFGCIPVLEDGVEQTICID